jgi:hypothetical protein
MMKKYFVYFLSLGACLSSCLTGQQLLQQSIQEYSALLNDPRLTQHLAEEEIIVEIDKNSSHQYTIETTQHILKINVLYANPKAGRGKFQLQFLRPSHKVPTLIADPSTKFVDNNR